MTFSATVVRVFLASPGDTEDERETARTAVARWNVEHAADEKVVLLPVGWETDSIPEWGEHPQSILNRQLLDACDVLVGIFWTRLGTPTQDGESGTVEEIERFATSSKPVLLYFCRKHAAIASIDTEQLDAVREFETACRDRALYDTYGDTAEFAAKLARALTRVVRDRFASELVADEGMPRGRRLAEPPRPKQEARLAAHLENHGRHSYRLVLANTGTVDVLGVNVEVPDEASSFWLLATICRLTCFGPARESLCWPRCTWGAASRSSTCT